MEIRAKWLSSLRLEQTDEPIWAIANSFLQSNDATTGHHQSRVSEDSSDCFLLILWS
jgi:hypothetical protein